MSDEINKDYPNGLVQGKRGFSIVWIVPIVAVLITAGMIWKSYSDAGMRIYITIENGEGIMDGKTPLMYKGIKIGAVEDVRIKEDDVSKLLLTVVVDKASSKSVARKGNQFWKVEPRISLTEVSGLDTLIKGVYIAVMPAATSKEALHKLPFETKFTALESAPVDVFQPGIALVVHTKTKGDIAIGAPILYNKQVIGKVEDKRLSNDKKGIDIYLRIEEKYVNLVHEKSLFYKSNALDIKASLSGVNVEMGSFASFIAGGIAMRNTSESLDSPLAKKNASFVLYNDETSTHLAEDEIILKMDKTYNLTPDISKVYCKGVQAGLVTDIHYDAMQDKTRVKIRLYKDFRALANEKAHFWIVRPALGFDKVEGLDTVVRGQYINFVSSNPDAKEKSVFELHENKPQIKGVHVKLISNNIESLSEGAGLFYRNIEIGLINSYVLNKDKKTFTIDMIVLPKYRNLLNASSLFYHNSGVGVKVDFSGVKVHAGSLETILRGGVAVITPNDKASSKLKKSYKLYKSHDAIIKAKYLAENGLHLTLVTNKLGSLKKASPVFFKQIKVGEVLSYKWDSVNKQLLLNIFVIEEYAKEVQQSTLFYNASGIRAHMDLNGLEIDTESVETIMAGGIAFYTPPSKTLKQARNQRRFKLYGSKKLAMENFLDLTLLCEDSSGLVVGSPLKYKNVILGHVEKIELKDKSVVVKLKVEAKYKDFIKKDTAFWLENFRFSLSGFKNASSAIKGPFIVLKPGVSKENTYVHKLMPKPPVPHFKEEGLRILLDADRLGGISPNTPLYYRQVQIGSVIKHALKDDATGVSIEVFVNPCYAHLIKENSYFYNASGIGMDVSLFGAKVKTETLKSIITGGIGVLTPDDYTQQAKEHHVFRLNENFDEDALKWRPKLQTQLETCK